MATRIRNRYGNLQGANALLVQRIVITIVLTPQIFGFLEKTRKGRGGEIQLTDGIRLLLEQQTVYAYMFEGTRYDAGDKLGFLKATVEFALRRDDLGHDFRTYLKSLKL